MAETLYIVLVGEDNTLATQGGQVCIDAAGGIVFSADPVQGGKLTAQAQGTARCVFGTDITFLSGTYELYAAETT